MSQLVNSRHKWVVYQNIEVINYKSTKTTGQLNLFSKGKKNQRVDVYQRFGDMRQKHDYFRIFGGTAFYNLNCNYMKIAQNHHYSILQHGGIMTFEEMYLRLLNIENYYI